MNKLIMLCTVMLVVLTPHESVGQSDAVTKAQQAAEVWLAMVDASNYGQSWEAAALLFKQALPKERWEEAVKVARTPFGPLKVRKLRSATFAQTLPGAPDGDYVVIQYDAQFEHKAAAVETITPMLEKDGLWKVSGYYIK